MRCLPSFLFYFISTTCQFDWPITQKNEAMETPQNKRFYFEVYSSSPLAQIYRKKRTPFSKAYMIKVRWYGKHVGENIANLGNPLGT